jgi:hypothetical protein
MSTDEMINTRRAQLRQDSPTLTEWRDVRYKEEEQRKEEALKRSSFYGDVPKDKTVELTADDDFLPYKDDIPNRFDLGQQQLDDEASGRSREPGSYSGKYLKPEQITINGYDPATGRKLKNVFDVPPEKMHSGLRKIRDAEYTLDTGADETGLTGASELAAAIIEEGGTYSDYQHIMSESGIPHHQQQLAFEAADEAIAQNQINEYLNPEVNPPSIEEEFEARQEVPADLTREQLPDIPEWMESAALLYKYEEGSEFEGDPRELVDWSLNEMANFNWRILGAPAVNGSSMSWYAAQATRYGGEYAQALHTLLTNYDRVDTDWGIVGSSAGALFSDPLTYASFGGGRVAAQAGAGVAKYRFLRSLAGMMAAGAAFGAAEAGGGQLAREHVGVEAGAQENVDWSNVKRMAGVGAAIGAGVGGALSEPAINLYRKGGKRLVRNAKTHQTPGPLRAQIGAVGNVEGVRPFQGTTPNETIGGNKRLQTALPTGKKGGRPYFVLRSPEEGSIGITNLESNPKVLAKQAEQIRAYDNYKPSREDLTDAEVVEEFKQHIVDNLLYLHDKMDPALRDQARQWYDGARRQVDTWADKYGVEDHQVAAVIANLSPQKDWFMNMSLAERTMDIYAEQMQTKSSKKMDDQVLGMYMKDAKGNPKPASKLTPADKAAMKAWEEYGAGKTLQQVIDDTPEDLVDLIGAQWVRAYDEVNNPRHHRVIAPDGTMMDFATNEGGARSGTGWGSYTEISKAFNGLRDPDIENISKRLGTAHKVRNFYNNIVSPNSNLGEVTVDTHAVAAGLLKPLSGGSHEVSHNFGSAPQKGTFGLPPGWERQGPGGSAAEGISGTYGIFADAYREAAAQRGILPREMQSITWEEIRTIFPSTFKALEKNVDAVNGVWREYKSGKISLEETREKIEELANVSEGRVPAWAGRSDTGSAEEGATSTYR